jgi:glycosyltransferase involved in cell wall biosynthesis
MTAMREANVTVAARRAPVGATPRPSSNGRVAGAPFATMSGSADPADVVARCAPAQRPMRVAVVTETWPPEVNGVATSLARIVDGLHRRGHALQLVRPRQSPGDRAGPRDRFDEVLTRGLPIPRYPGLRLGVPARRRLAGLWSVERPDVVHIATEGPLGFSALQAARRLGLPATSDFRTNFHRYSDHYGIGWLHAPIAAYLRTFHNRTRFTMVPTDALRRDLEADGFRRLRVVARGVDTVLFDPARRSEALRRRWGVGADGLVVACVGRLAPEKNLATLALAFDAVRREVPGARLLLVGDGPMRAELAAAWPQAIFAGQRTGEDLAAHYASADLFLFPSLTETFGNVTAEAMASGLPVVAYDYAAASQLIRHRDSGMLVPPGERLAFADAAVSVAIDPGARSAIGARARTAALANGWDGVVARFEQVLAAAIAGPGATQPEPEVAGRAALG